jgi:hypothetical protein
VSQKKRFPIPSKSSISEMKVKVASDLGSEAEEVLYDSLDDENLSIQEDEVEATKYEQEVNKIIEQNRKNQIKD